MRRLVLAATAMGGFSMLPGHPRVLLKSLGGVVVAGPFRVSRIGKCMPHKVN